MEEDEEKVSYRKCLIDCLNMDDPEHDPNLRDHFGYHPLTQLNVATNLSDTEFMYMAEESWEILLRKHFNDLCQLYSSLCFKVSYII